MKSTFRLALILVCAQNQSAGQTDIYRTPCYNLDLYSTHGHYTYLNIHTRTFTGLHIYTHIVFSVRFLFYIITISKVMCICSTCMYISYNYVHTYVCIICIRAVSTFIKRSSLEQNISTSKRDEPSPKMKGTKT